MDNILAPIQTERNQTTSYPTPQQTKCPTCKPRQCPILISCARDDMGLTVRTNHADRGFPKNHVKKHCLCWLCNDSCSCCWLRWTLIGLWLWVWVCWRWHVIFRLACTLKAHCGRIRWWGLIPRISRNSTIVIRWRSPWVCHVVWSLKNPVQNLSKLAARPFGRMMVSKHRRAPSRGRGNSEFCTGLWPRT